MKFKKMAIIALSLSLFLACGNKENEQKKKQETTVKKEVEKIVKVGIEKGNKIADFDLIDLNGKVAKITDYRGKVVLLNFWATWCPPCRKEMPSMEKLYQDSKNLDFEMLAISLDQKPTKDVVDFIKQNRYTFPVFHDTSGKLGSKFFVRSIPTTFILSKEGIILDKVIGAADWSKLNVIKLMEE